MSGGKYQQQMQLRNQKKQCQDNWKHFPDEWYLIDKIYSFLFLRSLGHPWPFRAMHPALEFATKQKRMNFKLKNIQKESKQTYAVACTLLI